MTVSPTPPQDDVKSMVYSGEDASVPAVDEVKGGAPVLPPEYKEGPFDRIHMLCTDRLIEPEEALAQINQIAVEQFPRHPADKSDISSLVAARCVALPGRLVDCPVCGAVDNTRRSLAEIANSALLTALTDLLKHDEQDAGCIPTDAHLDAQDNARNAIAIATGAA